VVRCLNPNPDPQSGQDRQNTFSFFDAVEPSKTEAMRDYFAPPKTPAFGEIQAYTTRLFFDWHVEVEDGEI